MAGIDNLVPPGRGFTAEEHSAGGKKSGEVRRLRAAVRKQLATKVPKKGMEDVHALMNEMGISKKDRNYSVAVAAAMVYKAAKGDKQCADWVRDTCGEKPTDKAEIDVGDRTLERMERIPLEDKLEMIEGLIHEFAEKDG